jgi:hypothetical protein
MWILCRLMSANGATVIQGPLGYVYEPGEELVRHRNNPSHQPFAIVLEPSLPLPPPRIINV